MRKKIGRIILVLLMISCMLLEGCGQKTTAVDKEVPMGRYIEKDVTAEQLKSASSWVVGMLKTKEGKAQLLLFEADRGLKLYERNDVGSWQEIKSNWLDKLNKMDYFDIGPAVSDKQGNFYIAYQAAEKESAITRIAKVTGEDFEIIKPVWQGGNNYKIINSIAILDNGDMLLGELRGTERYNLSDGSFIRSYEGKPSRLTVIDNKIYQINLEQGKVEVYALETGKQERSILCEGMDSTTRLLAGDKGDLYVFGKFGVKHITKNGTVWELLIDGYLTSFSMPSYEIKDMQFVNGAAAAVFYKNTGGIALKEYTYSKDTPTTPTTEMIAYSLKENMCLRQIAAQYQLSHPDVKVTLQIGLDKDSSLTEADAVKALNTELMAGKGPDLILLDGLNEDTYIQKGVLADMSEWTKDAEEIKQCFPNIITAYSTKDKVYALPVHFTVPMLWGNKNIIDHVRSLEDLAAYQIAHGAENLTSYKTAEEFICKFGKISSLSWFNGKGELQEDRIISFLEAIKTLEKKGKKIEYNEAKGEKPPTPEEMQMPSCSPDEALYVAYQYAAVQFAKPSGMNDFLTCAAANRQIKDDHVTKLPSQSEEALFLINVDSAKKEISKGDFTMLSAQQEGVFEPRSILGVNASSKKQDIAKDIIRMALSDSIQSVDIKDGFPVNKINFEKWMQGKSFDKNWNCMYGTDIDGKTCTLMIQWGGYEAELKKYAEECQKLKTPIKTDSTLLKIVLDESKGYFEGEMTAEAAAKVIKEKIVFYLAE